MYLDELAVESLRYRGAKKKRKEHLCTPLRSLPYFWTKSAAVKINTNSQPISVMSLAHPSKKVKGYRLASYTVEADIPLELDCQFNLSFQYRHLMLNRYLEG